MFSLPVLCVCVCVCIEFLVMWWGLVWFKRTVSAEWISEEKECESEGKTTTEKKSDILIPASGLFLEDVS